MEDINMAFKSKAQQQRFKDLLRDGVITKAEYNKWEKDTPHNLPEHTIVVKKQLKSKINKKTYRP